MTNTLQFTLVLDGKQYTGTLQAAEEATRRFTETTTAGSERASDALRGMGGAADAAAAGGRRAGDALRDMTGQANAAAAASTKAGDAIRRMTQVDKLNAARDILDVRSFHVITREIQQVEAAYKRLADSGKLSAQELAVANQAQQASVQRLKQEMQGLAQAHDRTGMSAGQHAMAMRMLPMQMTDVAVSIASGMPVWMVAIQQGGQLKDAFGGVGAAAKAVGQYVVALLNPMTAAAAVAGVLAFAHEAGAEESRAFERALIMTGGRVGLTSGQLSDMAGRMDDLAGVTRGQASEALAMLASQAGITSGNIERIASAAMRMQAVGGPAVEETAKAFSSLAQSPLAASIKLHEQTGFLTESVYRQIRALEAQGRTTEAAKVAQEAYAASLEQRIPELEKNLGTLERAWKGVTTFAREAWDAMLNVGREKSVGDKIAEAEKKITDLQKARDGGGTAGGKRRSTFDAEIAAEQAKLDALREQQKLAERTATTKASEAAKVSAQINSDGGAGDRQRAIAAANIDAQLAQERAAAEARIRVIQRAREDLDALQSAGLVTARQHVEQALAIDLRELQERRKLLDEQIRLEGMKPVKADDPAAAAQRRARLTDLRSERDAVREQIAQAPKVSATQMMGIDVEDARAVAQEWATAMESTRQQAESLAVASARTQAQLISDPLERARAEADITAKEIERSTSRAATALQNQIDILRGRGLQGQADALQAQLAAVQAGAAQAAAAARTAPDLKLVDDLLKKDVGSQMADGFDRASQSMSAVVNSFRSMLKVQDDYTKALATQGLTEEKAAALKRGQNAAQLNSYAMMAAAAKGMLKEHTAGYKALAAAEKAFRVAEMVGAAQASSAKIALWWSGVTAKVAAVSAEVTAAVSGQGVETGAVVAGEATRNAAKVPGVFLAYMSALGPWGMAAAGAAVAAVLGGAFGGRGGSVPSAADRQAANGTGTVLGDSGAKSESIKGSLDALADVDKLTMQYSAQMAASLRSIESSMAGVSTQILRAGGINTGKNLGISTGASGAGDAIGSLLSKIPLIGGALGGIVGGVISGIFGKSSTSITDAGLSISGTAAQMQQGLGVSQYADATTTKKSWFGSSTRTRTMMQDAGDDVTRQFGLIFGGVSASLQSAAGAMGQDAAAVGRRLAGYVIDIPRLSLQGLKGDDLQQAISAAVGAKADDMAKLVAPGLDGFQKVGEGYFETTVRVASATESASEMLRRLGIGAVSLSDIVNKQGDVGAELVRQSIARAETVAGGAASSLGRIIDSLDGSAQDLADTYRALVDVRTVLRSVGIDGQAVTADLIRGAGSLEALKTGTAAYEEKFLSAAEQTALKTSRMTAEFARLGVALPATAADFRRLVEGASAATSAGQEQLGGLLALSSAFSEFIEETGAAADAIKSASEVASEREGLEERLLELQGNTAALRARELARLDSSNRSLQERIWALEDEKAAADALAASGKGIAAFLEELRGGAAGTASLAARRAAYQTDLASAQAGDAEASARVVTSAKALIESVKASASDPLAVARETARIAGQLDALPATMAYAAQQANDAAQKAITTAATSSAVAAPASVPSAVPAQYTQTQGSGQDAMLVELKALRTEVATLRQSLESTGAQTVTNTGKTARILEAVSQDGDAISTRAVR